MSDPYEQKLTPNPAYDPEKPFGLDGNTPAFVDPTAGMPRTFAKFELEYQRAGPLNELLRLLAVHRLPPPDWLAERILDELPVKKRKNTPPLLKILSTVAEADRLQSEKGYNKFEQADELNTSHATLTRWRALSEVWYELMDAELD